MKKQSFSFWNLVTINVGSMVGVGIFFKNPKILAATGGNIWLSLLTWLVGAILVYGMGLSFAEAQSYTGKNNISGTVPNWVTTFIGPKTGRIAQQIFGWIYYPVFSVLLSYYAVAFVLLGMGWTWASMETKWKTVWALSSIAYLALSTGNVLSYSFGKGLQMVGTIIKFIPLLSVVVLGFTRPVAASDANTFAAVASGAVKWNIATVFTALPGVFFAFDAFMGGLTLSKEEEKPGDATKATMFSIISVGIFYFVFAAATGYGTKDASLFELFQKTFGSTGASVLWFLIGISAYTVANGFQVAGARVTKAMSDEKATIPSKYMSKIESDGRHTNQTWIGFFIGMFYMALMFIIADVTGDSKEATFDNFGSALALFAFAFYAVVGFGVVANRFTNKFKVDKQKLPILQFGAAVISLWVVVQNTVNYFIAGAKTVVDFKTQTTQTSPTVMWLIVLTLFITFVTTKIADLINNEYN